MPETSDEVRRVTVTRSGPDGSVVVVRDVPAQVQRSAQGQETVAYADEVAERLEALIKDALLAHPGPNRTVPVHWDDGAALPPCDLELRFGGPENRYGIADTSVWEGLTHDVDTAFRTIARELSRSTGIDIPSPRVVYLGPGSLRMGLRSSVSDPPTGRVEPAEEAALRTLHALASAPMMLAGEPSATDGGPGTNPRLGYAAMRALETLTPSTRDPENTVELIPSPDVFPDLARSLLRSDLLPAIRERRRQLDSRDQAQEAVVLEGEIDSVSIDARLHLRKVIAAEGDWGRWTTADIHFDDELFDEVVDLFRRRPRVRLRGVRGLGPGDPPQRLELVSLSAIE